MGTITKMVQQGLERYRQKQMMCDKLTQPGWEDAANYCCGRDRKDGKSELLVPAVIQPHTDSDTAAPAPTPFGVLMECLDIVPRISQMPQGTS